MDLSALLSGSKETVTTLVTFLLTAFSVLLGAYMIVSGLAKMIAFSKGERNGQATAGPIVINLLVGAMLIQLSASIDMIVESIFGGRPEDPNGAMSYMPPPMKSSPTMEMAVTIGVYWIYAIGFMAIIRGFVLWNELASGGGRGSDNGWKGFWHVLAGAACVNITGTIRVLTS